MSVEANKALIRRYVETWNGGDPVALARFWSPDVVHHTRTQANGFEAVKAIVAGFMHAFPDLHFEIEDIVAEGDRVATRMRATATHSAAYIGVPPTGRKIDCEVMSIARVDGGRIVEHWGVTDELALMQQIGLLPTEYLAAMA